MTSYHEIEVWVTIFVILEHEKHEILVYVSSIKSIFSIFKGPEWSNICIMIRTKVYIINNYVGSD